MTSAQIKNSGFGGAPSFYPEETHVEKTETLPMQELASFARQLLSEQWNQLSSSVSLPRLAGLFGSLAGLGCATSSVGANPNATPTESKSPPAKKIEYSHSVSAPTQSFSVSQQTVTAEKHQQTVTVEKFHTEVEVKKSRVEVTVRSLYFSPLKLSQVLQQGQALNFSKLLKPDTTVTRVKLQYVHQDHWQAQDLKNEEVVVPAERMKRPGQYVLQVSIEDPSAPNSAGFWLYFKVESPKP